METTTSNPVKDALMPFILHQDKLEYTLSAVVFDKQQDEMVRGLAETIHKLCQTWVSARRAMARHTETILLSAKEIETSIIKCCRTDRPMFLTGTVADLMKETAIANTTADQLDDLLKAVGLSRFHINEFFMELQSRATFGPISF